MAFSDTPAPSSGGQDRASGSDKQRSRPHGPGLIRGVGTSYEVLRPIMKLWYLLHLSESDHVPSPRDEPAVWSTSSDADTVLLLGNGPTHGWGTTTHQLALTGQLAREIGNRTGRACSVNLIGDEMMNVSSAKAWLGGHDLTPYDAIVIVIGMNDAVRLTPLDTWRKKLTELVSYVTSAARFSARVILVGIQPVRSVSVYDMPLGNIAERHAIRLNLITQSLAEQDGLSYSRLPAAMPDPDGRLGSPFIYRSWASDVADQVVPALASVGTEEAAARRLRSRPVETWDWAGAETFVSLAATGGSQTMRDIAAEAQDEFGVDLAVVSLVEGQTLYYGLSTNLLPRSIPLALSFCETTVKTDEPFIVTDSRKHLQFRDNPYLDLNHGYFYAGHPIHASDGRTIGSFCLHHTRPKKMKALPLERLKQFALRAETELQSYEPAHR